MADVLAQDDPFSVGPGSLMATAPDAGSPAPPAQPVDAIRERMLQNLDRQQSMIDRTTASMDRQDQIGEQREKALAPLRQKQMEVASRPIPEPPAQKAPPDVPQRRSKNEDEDWLQASMILGALAGGFTRRHMTNALAAMQGSIEGYNEGSRQKFDQNMKIWEAENKKTIESNKQAMDHYRDILENRKLNMDQMSVELQIAAATYDDKAMAEAARSKNTLVIAQLYDKQAQSLSQFEKSATSLAKQHADAKQREWETQAKQYADSPAGLAVANAMVQGRYPLPPTSQRTGFEGARNVAIRDKAFELAAEQGVVLDAATYGAHQVETKTPKMVERQQALIPGRVQAAGETAAARTAGVAGTNIELASRSAGPIIEMAGQASRDVPRTEFLHLNKLFQMAETEISDPALARFKLVNEELATMLARVLNPRSSVITVSGMEHARNLISTATSPEAYQTILLQIKQLTEREYKVVKEQQRGDPLSPISVPTGARGASAGDVAGGIRDQATGATEQTLPGSVGRTEPSGVRIGAQPPGRSAPASPVLPEWLRNLPEGWKVTPKERQESDQRIEDWMQQMRNPPGMPRP